MINAAGRMGWKSDEFWFSTPSFFYSALRGHMEQERDRFHQNLAAARIVAYYAVAPHLEKGKGLKLSDIITLPGDDIQETPQFEQVTAEELAAFSALADRGYEQHTGNKWQA